MILTVSYTVNGVWKKASKSFEDTALMKQKIKEFLENTNYENQCYWIDGD